MRRWPEPQSLFGVTVAAKLAKLEPVLVQWVALMLARWGEDDAPWWYNERASLSQFVGAIWKSGGWAFEEYAVPRKAGGAGPAPDSPGRNGGLGRCDLMLEQGDFQAIAEAKQRWPRITRGGNISAAVDVSLSHAAEQVVTAPHQRGYQRLAIVFVSPIATKKLVDDDAKFTSRLRGLSDSVTKSKSRAVAWAFPAHSRRLKSKRRPGLYYPGTMVVIAPVRGNGDVGQ